MSKKFFIEDSEWAVALEQKYQDYMYELMLWLAPEEDLKDNNIELPKTLSGEPYCGCSTCETREQLFFLVPKIIEAYKEGKIVLAEDEK